MTGRWRTPAGSLAAGTLLVASLVLVGCAQPPAEPSATAGPVVLRVTSIADGDTFTGTDPAGAKVKVRVLSIDAPELAHDGNRAECGSAQASARLRELLSGQRVVLVADLRSDATDRFGRRLGYAELDGRDLGLQLVAEGLAEAWYPSGEPRPERFDAYADAERTARQDRTGSWDSCTSLGR